MFERPLKLSHNAESRVFFTSDTHFGHTQPFIYQKRGYDTVLQHDKAIIDKINEVVGTNDTLFHLGDFCLNTIPPRFEEIVNSINCKNIAYIWGNHNSCIRRQYEETVAAEYQRKNIEVYPYVIGKITYLGHYKELIINGQLIVVQHFPIYSWNVMKRGAWCLHGHEHCAVKEHLPEHTEGKILDVGWDYYQAPISFDYIKDIMLKKKIKNIGHH